MAVEQALNFRSEQLQLAAILHFGGDGARYGVVVVVGGPQYRVGSHRQFVHLARHLAKAGIATLRFDVAGMGDSEGEKRRFDALDGDICAAIDAFLHAQPQLEGVVLWGVCDGASAALIYGASDPRVRGVVMVNPWLEDEGTRAQAWLLDYYLRRLLSPTFWHKLLEGGLRWAASARELASTITQLRRGAEVSALSYQQRMRHGLEQSTFPLLIVLSGEDLTAREFERSFSGRNEWRRSSRGKDLVIERLPEADHTFSSTGWKSWLAEVTTGFIRRLEASP